VWGFWSRTQHADPAAVYNWITIAHDDGSATVLLGPERRTDIVRGTLTVMICEVRDLGGMLAAQTATAVPGLDVLDHEVVEAARRHGITV